MKFNAVKVAVIYTISCLAWFAITGGTTYYIESYLPAIPSRFVGISMLALFVLMNAFFVFKLINLNNKTIKHNESTFLSMYLGNPNPLWIYDLETLEFVSVNKAAVTHYGYSEDEFLSMTINDIRKPEDRIKVKEAVSKWAQTEYGSGIWRISGTWQHQKKNGVIIYVSITSHKIEFQNRECVMVLAVDTTERVEYEQELQLMNQRLSEEKQKLNQTEKLAKVSGWEYYIEDGSLIWSDELYEIFDFDREKDLVNYSRLLKTVYQEDLSAYNTAIENLLKHGRDLNIAYRFVTKNGHIKFVRVLGKMEYLDGKLFKAQGTMQDITELKMMQLEKNTYLQRLNNTLENITDGYYLLNHNWVITDINFNCIKLLGLQRADIVNRTYLEVFPESANTKFYHSYKRVFQERVLVNFEEFDPIVKKWFCVNAYPTDEGIAVYFSDVTESKQKDLQLKEALDRYNLIAKATKDVIYDWDVATDTITYSQSINDLLFLECNEIKYDMIWWKSKIHTEDLEKVLATYREAVEKMQTNCGLEYRMRTSSGSYKYVYDQGYLMYDDNGKLIRLIGALKDIDQLKQFDNENKRLADIITKVNNMIIIQDVEGKATWVNKAFETFTGFTMAEIIGKFPGELLNGPESDLTMIEYIVANKKSYKSFACEVVHYTKKNQKYWGKVEFTPLFNVEGKPEGYISVQTDITLQKEKANRVSRQNEILKNIAWMSSHELRRPVASILGLMEVIRHASDEADKTESLQLMQTCTQNLDQIVRTINQKIEEEISEE
jgi:PAS domain S-box-containing protein